MFEMILNLPLWQMIRSSGVIAYLFLTVGMSLGILYSFPVWNGKTKALLYKWHTTGTIGGTAIGLIHGVLTVIDPYVPFAWREVLVPFAAKTDPVWNGLGTLAGYGMLIVILTSDLRNKLGKKIWLALHMLSYPVFLLSFLHGFFAGTDTSLPGIRWMYILSFALTLGLILVRGFLAAGPKSKGSASPKVSMR